MDLSSGQPLQSAWIRSADESMSEESHQVVRRSVDDQGLGESPRMFSRDARPRPHRAFDGRSPRVLGYTVDDQTRCVHYHKPTDVIALKFKCCGDFYPCYKCHEETTDHAIEGWSDDDLHEPAVLCGVCGTLLTIAEYLGLAGNSACSVASAPDDADALRGSSSDLSSTASLAEASDASSTAPLAEASNARRTASLNEPSDAYACPNCRAAFNPGCSRHYGIYFNFGK